MLIPDSKRNREVTSKMCLTLFNRNPEEFSRRFVTVDETWIRWYSPETKEQSKQRVLFGERAPTKAKTVPSTRKRNTRIQRRFEEETTTFGKKSALLRQ